MSVSETDFEKIREMLRATFRNIRVVVAASEPVETVAVLNLNAFQLTPRAQQR